MEGARDFHCRRYVAPKWKGFTQLIISSEIVKKVEDHAKRKEKKDPQIPNWLKQLVFPSSFTMKLEEN